LSERRSSGRTRVSARKWWRVVMPEGALNQTLSDSLPLRARLKAVCKRVLGAPV